MPKQLKGEEMQEKPIYTKLSNLVNQEFVVLKVNRWSFKKYDPESKRMLMSDSYEQGYSKVYQLDTDKGKLDIRAGQLGNMLEGCVRDGVSDINNQTFLVKSNGKTGIDIRYYLNPVRKTTTEPQNSSESKSDNTYNLEDIPY